MQLMQLITETNELIIHCSRSLITAPINPTCAVLICKAMIGENWQLGAYEPVEFEK
jgi:hypothetical protein